jgi:Fe-S oxidoreductase
MHERFAPGCALMLYKPHLAERIHGFLKDELGPIELLSTCCKNQPVFPSKARVINICPGCDRRFRENYEDSTTISLWEILAGADCFSIPFPFPDYHGKPMSIMDACPTRDQPRVQNAIRTLLKKMNITLIEPRRTGPKSICCGDGSYGEIPVDKVKELMIRRASEMPVDDVVVYCVSCVKSAFIGGRTPHYMVDLLFGEETVPRTLEPDVWHAELDAYIREH